MVEGQSVKGERRGRKRVVRGWEKSRERAGETLVVAVSYPMSEVR